MKDYLYKIIQNKNKKLIMQIIVSTILGLIILNQIYTLTNFVIKYKQTLDYGNGIKNICNDGYIEYETPRFQFSKNNFKIMIENDVYSSQYNGIFLLICIIILLYFNLLVLLTYASGFVNISTFLSDLNVASLTSDITSIIVLMIQYLLNGTVDNNSVFVTALKILLTSIFYLSIIYLVASVPLYFIIDHYLGTDISPFSSSYWPKIIHGIFIMILSTGMFSSTNINKDPKNLNSDPKLPSSISPFLFTSFLTMYFVTFHAVKVVYNIYKKTLRKKTDTYETRSREYTDNNSSENNNLLYNWGMIVYTELKSFVSNAFWIDSGNEVSLKKIVGLYVAIILIFVFFQLLLYLKPESYLIFNQFDEKSDFDKNLLFYLGTVPCIVLFIICFTILITKEYNTSINKYLVYKPNSIYKSNMAKINQQFNKIIENDKSNIQNNSVCKNVANGIHLVLLSFIFKSINPSLVDNLFIPEYEYESGCETNRFIQYDKANEYDIEKMIDNNGGVFFKDTKCSSIDNGLLLSVMKGVIPKYDLVVSDKDYENMKSFFIRKLKNAIYFSKNGKTYSGDRNFKLTTEYEMNNLIFYVEEINEVEGVSSMLIDDHLEDVVEYVANEYINYVKYMHEYTLKTITALCKCTSTEQYVNKGYEILFNKMSHTIIEGTNGTYSLNIKKAYINRFNLKMKEMFDNINVRLSSSIVVTEDNYKLSKMIIENYNSYQEHTYNLFRGHRFFHLDDRKKEISFDDIKDAQDIMKSVYEIVNSKTLEDSEEILIEKLEELRRVHNELKSTIQEFSFESNPKESSEFSIKLTYITNNISILDKYINKIDNTNELLYKELYHNEFQIMKSKIEINDRLFTFDKTVVVENDQVEYAQYIDKMASSTSLDCYTLVIIYVAVLLSTTFIQ
jgi:hypothetical protein